jgi:hypothetical protein
MRIDGGVGWPDYKAMEWSPDSTEIALTYNTNGVGVWDPFGKTNKPRVHAYVTDGNSRPPGFSWYPDGKAVFIASAYFEGFDDSIFGDDEEAKDAYFQDKKNGCRMEVYHRRGDLIDGIVAAKAPAAKLSGRKLQVFAHLLGLKADKKSVAYKDDQGNIAVCNAESVSFYRADKSLYGRFVDRDPGTDSPVVIDYKDYGKYYTMSPAFGINIDGQEHWGLAFEQGVIIAPSDFDAAKYLNWSLGHHWSWPLDWCAYQRYETLEAWHKEKPKETPYWLRSHIGIEEPATKASAAKSKSTKKTSTTPDRTYDDIRSMAISTLTALRSGWDTFKGDYLSEIAICDLLHGDIDKVGEVINLISKGQFTQFASHIGFHSLRRFKKLPVPDLEERLLQSVKDVRDYDIPQAYAALAMFLFELGRKKEAKEYLDEAIKKRTPENNSGQNRWPVVDTLLMSGNREEAFKYMKEWGLREGFYSRNVITNAMWYGTLDDVRELSKTHENYDAAQIAAEKIKYDKDWNSLESFKKQLDNYYDQCVSTVADAMLKEGIKIDIYTMLPGLTEPGNYSWHRAMDKLIQYLPAEIPAYFSKIKPDLAKVLTVRDQEYKHLSAFSFARAVQTAGMADQWTAEAAKLEKNLQVAYLLGRAAASAPDETTALIQQAMNAIPKTVDIYRRQTIFQLSCIAAYASRTPLYEQFVSEAQEEAIRRDKDLSLSALSDTMIDYGDIETAHKTWLKIPKGTRKYRISKLLKHYCRHQDFNHVYALLMSLKEDDLNDRPSHAISALAAIVNGRKNHLKF